MRNNFIKLEAREKAQLFRRSNGYGSTDPISLTSLLIKNNIITLFKPLSDQYSGMAIKGMDDSRFILVNQNNVLGRQRFTISHELYHLFFQDEFTSQKCITCLFDKQQDIDEKKADYFASYFLLPDEGIMELIPNIEKTSQNKISTETIFKIQQYYRISINAVIFRLNELDFVDKSYFNLYTNEKANIARSLGYETSIYFSGNKGRIIGDYCILANSLFKERKLSESQYFDMLNAINFDPFKTNIKDE